MLTQSEFADRLRKARSLLITTHKSPDGHGVGCQLALYNLLRSPDRAVTVLTVGEIPERYRFLSGAREALDWTMLPDERKPALLREHELILVVDTHSYSMLGDLGEVLAAGDDDVLFLDHHPIKGDAPEAILCDPSASSTGEVCWQVIKALDVPVTPEVATCIYLSIAYDTNFFKYLRRRPETHRIAAELVESGADSDEVYRSAFASKSISQVALTGAVLRSYQMGEGGMVAWAMLGLDLIQQTKAKPDELRDVITQLLEIEGVEVALTFKDRGNGEYKVSMRSKGRYPINRVAARLGGGGHMFAAGAHVPGSAEDVTQHVLALVHDLIRETGTHQQA